MAHAHDRHKIGHGNHTRKPKDQRYVKCVPPFADFVAETKKKPKSENTLGNMSATTRKGPGTS